MLYKGCIIRMAFKFVYGLAAEKLVASNIIIIMWDEMDEG